LVVYDCILLYYFGVDIKLNQSQSSVDLIVENIRDAIISGELLTGHQLKQDHLAAQFSVSKIPIREALNQLKTEGLVVSHNNRGSVVSSLSIEEVEEIYTMRLTLEEVALKRCIENLELEHIIAAETALRLTDQSDDPVEWARLNWQFHTSLYEAAGMSMLMETVTRLHNNVARYMVLYLKEMDYKEVSQAEHWVLLEACKDKKSRVAINILRIHLKDALRQTMHYMQLKDQCH